MYTFNETQNTDTTTILKNNHNSNNYVLSNIISKEQSNILENMISNNIIKNPKNLTITNISQNEDIGIIPRIRHIGDNIIDYQIYNEFDLTVYTIFYNDGEYYYLSVYFDDTLQFENPIIINEDSYIEILSQHIFFKQIDTENCKLNIYYTDDTYLYIKEYNITTSGGMSISTGDTNSIEIDISKYNKLRLFLDDNINTCYFISNYDDEFKFTIGNITTSTSNSEIKELPNSTLGILINQPIDEISNIYIYDNNIHVYNIYNFFNSLTLKVNLYDKQTLVYGSQIAKSIPNHNLIDLSSLKINILKVNNQTSTEISIYFIENYLLKKIDIKSRDFQTSDYYVEKNIITLNKNDYLNNIIKIYDNVIDINNYKTLESYFINNSYYLCIKDNVHIDRHNIMGYNIYQSVFQINIETPIGLYFISEDNILTYLENNNDNWEIIQNNKNIKFLGLLYNSGEDYIFIDQLGV